MAPSKREVASIEARHFEIVGKPPRIPPVDRATVAEEVQATTARLLGGLKGDTKPRPLESIPEIMFTLCRFPEIWDRVMALALQIQGKGLLPPRIRQLVILRTAWLLRAPYEWGEHVRHSKLIGMTSEEIERITRGPTAEGWTPDESAALGAVDELKDAAMISDDIWSRLAAFLDDRQIFELIVLVGHFTNVAYFQNSLRLKLEPGNAGLSAR